MAPIHVLNIGHSTRPIDEFLRLITAHGVERLIDIRTVPRSRHNPQFSADTLSLALQHAGIRYSHLPGLGGLRRARRDSTNTGWRNSSFRGYADYMQTEAFRSSLDECIELAGAEQVVLMCAEAVPWRCHRALVADALLVRGIAVSEIVSAVRTRPHVVTPWAQLSGLDITYAAPPDVLSAPVAERTPAETSTSPAGKRPRRK